MNVNIEAFVMIAAATLLGSGMFSTSFSHGTSNFDYSDASPEQRSRYMESAAYRLNDYFSPNFVVKSGTYTTSGRSITYTYNVKMSKLKCDTEETCEVMQCRRYLNSDLSTNNISLKIRYQSAKQTSLGSQVLKNVSCKEKVAQWEGRKS